MNRFRIWLAQRIAPMTPILDDQMRAARILFAAAEDSKLALRAMQGAIGQPGMGALMVATQAVTNLDNAMEHARRCRITRARTLDGDA